MAKTDSIMKKLHEERTNKKDPTENEKIEEAIIKPSDIDHVFDKKSGYKIVGGNTTEKEYLLPNKVRVRLVALFGKLPQFIVSVDHYPYMKSSVDKALGDHLLKIAGIKWSKESAERGTETNWGFTNKDVGEFLKDVGEFFKKEKELIKELAKVEFKYNSRKFGRGSKLEYYTRNRHQEAQNIEEGAKFKVGDKVKLDKANIKDAKKGVDLDKVYTIKTVEPAFSEPYVYYFKEMPYNVPERLLVKAK